MPAMRPNCRSKGVATAEAIVCGSAPGSEAPTEMTGNSTCGSGATGRKLKANAPDKNSANVSSDVPTGRLINGAEIFMISRLPPELQSHCQLYISQISVRPGQTRDKPPALCIA